ncbi:MAG: uL22 family ribosomal protein [Candidatus Nanoarchaeia archaeon]|nr:uL22 family ribosomal protein [Candidatus Nanoarchaeia archaeon]MDD5053986.1 uL22 family ribosomal protein [Candidatus Nanoarchaeia archaeon]
MSEEKEMSAIANVTVPASFKNTVNIGKWIKEKSVDSAISMLLKVIEKEIPLPCVRFNKDVPHKKGLGFGGRYPKNACEHAIKTLKLLKDNAKAKGFDESKLIITEFIANYAISKNKKARHNAGKSTHIMIKAEVKQ